LPRARSKATWSPPGSWRPTCRTCARGRRSTSTGTAGAARDLTASLRTVRWPRTSRPSWCGYMARTASTKTKQKRFRLAA
jgi:hypothetical protein